MRTAIYRTLHSELRVASPPPALQLAFLNSSCSHRQPLIAPDIAPLVLAAQQSPTLLLQLPPLPPQPSEQPGGECLRRAHPSCCVLRLFWNPWQTWREPRHALISVESCSIVTG